MNTIFRLVFLIVALTATLAAPATVETVDPARITASPDQERATELITHFIRRYHYRNRDLNDALSEQIFDRYLEALDPNRSYFLAGDIAEFRKYRDRLDDALIRSELAPAFEIFLRLRGRLEERIDYAKSLLERGFDYTIDEDYVLDRSELPWATDRAELDAIWRRRVKNDALSLKLSGKTGEEIVETLRDRYDRLAVRIGQFDSDDVYQAFINSYTASIEPHTSYFSRQASDNFKIRMSLSLEGIGAALQTDNDYTVVRRVIPGGPAALSGTLHTRDRITGVGQGDDPIVNVVGWRLADVVDLIRGPKDTVVRLELLPKGTPLDGPTKVIRLVRDTIKLEEQAAQKKLVDVGDAQRPLTIGVIRVPTFYTDFEARERGDRDFRSTTQDVRRLIAELLEEKVTGIVIDLRGNGGGSLAEATELTGLFIGSGPIVQVKDSTGRVSVNDDPDPDIAYTGPLAVLVDRQSASASEIFAGAIQDYRRGVVIGEPTFGKGTVQRLVDLSRFTKDNDGRLGQLKFTIAQFFRISGESTQHRGVVPDIIFPHAIDDEDQGERSLDNALPWAAVRPARFVSGQLNDKLLDEVRMRHRKRVETDPGFQYLLAEASAAKQARDKKSVSLLETTRRATRDKMEKDSLERLNRYRSSRGLEPLEKLLTEEEEEEEELADEGQESEQEDVLRTEAARILGDIIRLATAPRLMTSRSVTSETDHQAQ